MQIIENEKQYDVVIVGSGAGGGMDRFKKLSKVISDEEKAKKFLKAGDKVLVKGEGLGSVELEIVE